MNTSARPPIEEACYWLASRRREPDAALQGAREADVAIVGAGYTGLWTALRLKELEPRLELALLDQRSVAYGASGRNAGMLGETIDHSHELAVAHFGREEAARLARLGRENLDELLAFLADRRIDCDLEPNGMLHVALLPSQVAELRAAQACAASLGIGDLRLLDASEARAEIHCDRYE